FYEPIATFIRFIFLLFLFTPLVITFPITYFGTQTIIDSSVDSVTGVVNTVKIRHGEQLWYRYITWAMEHAGPSFIKLGQWAASRTDIFPEGLCLQMAKLHSNAKKHSFRQTKSIIERSFGNDILFEDIFEEFIKEPMGVGAIAQVYKAKLKKGLVPIDHALSHSPSKWVAIKVIHPGIDVIIERDLTIMRVFANFINWLPNMEWLSLPGEVEVFAQMMRTQLDLRIEANNLLVFRHNFAKKNDIKFPRPFIDYSSKRVLVEEYITGISMEKLLANAESHKLGSLEREASGRALDSFLKMMLLDNFIHSDLHPGNIMVRFYRNDHDLGDINSNKFEDEASTQEINKITNHLSEFSGNKEEWRKELKILHDEGYHTQVCFIDTGLVTVLNEKNRHNFLDLFKAISEFDGYKAGELMIERSRTPDSAQNPEIFSLRVQKLVRNIKDRTFALGNVRLDDLLGQMLSLVRLHHVRMECDFITVILSIMLIEGIGRQLNPDLDLLKSSLPILRQVSAQERNRLLKDSDVLSMVKIWALLEIRQLISASVNDINTLVKYDWLAPN
ncbi:atypical/ABC1/ABC1-C protein kinase, partial [Nadsonia fulvescens var. elongata DSM 6958]